MSATPRRGARAREPRWISKAAALAIHDRLVAEHGGARGLRDEGGLESALASPRNHFAHGVTDRFALAAALAHEVTRDHAFHDGNKRMSLALAGVFLELNGYRLEASEHEAAAATLALAARQLDEQGYAEWLRESSVRVRRPRAR
jgi:death on curing protein